MRRKIFILVPSLSPTGPVKGAIALANSLINERQITLVSVKDGPGASAFIDERIRRVCLSATSSGIFGRLRQYKNLLAEAGNKDEVASISMCFSADFINIFCRRYAITCSSIRGNLVNIYKMDYGILGLPIAIIHLVSLIKFDKVVAMSLPMAHQIQMFTRRRPSIIGNFVDETQLGRYRKMNNSAITNAKRFVFVGSVSSRKKPLLLVETVKKLHDEGFDLHLDLIGDGPLMKDTIDKVFDLDLREVVTIHGQLPNPYLVISKADVFILPSLSEGTSRASLEALFIGLPCILRKIDGNAELVNSGSNGILFETDSDLYYAMLSGLELVNEQSQSIDFLPKFFRQEESSQKYLKLVEGD